MKQATTTLTRAGPEGSLKSELIERSRALIQSYEAFCNGCVRSGLKGIR